MSSTTWDNTWMDVAFTVARRSRCSKRQCGAVIVTPTNRIVSTGYNGPPSGYETTGDCSLWCERAQTDSKDDTYSTCPSVHAEMNALMFTDRSVREGGSLYVTSSICITCAKAIANSGLTRVVMVRHIDDSYREPDRTVAFLRQCGLTVVTV